MKNNDENIKLLYHSPLPIIVEAVRICHKSFDRSDNLGEKDKNLVKKIMDIGHLSIFEHAKLGFYTNIDRIRKFFHENKYSYERSGLVITNLRVIIENAEKIKEVIRLLLHTEFGFLFYELIDLFRRACEVYQFSADGHLIKKWLDKREAAASLNIDIEDIDKSIKGLQQTAGGFYWRDRYES